jgi:hypothetical protein
MDDGNELTVSLKDYPHPDIIFRPFSLYWTDNTFHRNGCRKEGGCPRHAHYTKGNIRDEKALLIT